MPITQDRLLVLRTAARSALDAFNDLRGVVRLQYDKVVLGHITAEHALNEILSSAEHITVNAEALVALGQEEGRLTRAVVHRNRRRAARAREKRGGAHEEDFGAIVPRAELQVAAMPTSDDTITPPCPDPAACDMPVYKGQCVTCGHVKAEAMVHVTPDGEHYVIKDEKGLTPSDLAGVEDIFAGDGGADDSEGEKQ